MLQFFLTTTIQILKEESSKYTFEKVGALSALFNVKVWYLAIICFMIQVVNYGLNFYLPTHVASLLGAKVYNGWFC